MSAILAVLIFFVFSYIFKSTNIFSFIGSKLSGNPNTEQCIASMTEEAQTFKFIFGFSGVPEEKTDIALNEMIIDNCDCVISAAGALDVEAFILDENNSETLKKCSENATRKSIEKYAVDE